MERKPTAVVFALCAWAYAPYAVAPLAVLALVPALAPRPVAVVSTPFATTEPATVAVVVEVLLNVAPWVSTVPLAPPPITAGAAVAPWLAAAVADAPSDPTALDRVLMLVDTDTKPVETVVDSAATLVFVALSPVDRDATPL
jgi:hypothetical protein